MISAENKTVAAINRHKKLWIVGMFGAIVFFSCCIFPLSKYAGGDSIAWLNLAMFIVSFVYMGAIMPYFNLFAGKLGLNLLCALVAIVGGLLCRYLLEFGEISNVYNFTLGNIAFFVLGALLLVVAGFGWTVYLTGKQVSQG